MKYPCVRNCCLDDHDICMGCFRTLQEILAWSAMTEKQQQAVLQDCQLRRKHKPPSNNKPSLSSKAADRAHQ